MKVKITLVLVALLLTGWGCQNKSTVSNQPEAGQDTVVSVDVSAPPDTTGQLDTSALDTIKPKDTIVIEDADGIKGNQKDASPDTKVPKGWKVYEVPKWQIAYPSIWYVKADNIQNPQPPDLQRVFFDTKPIFMTSGTESFYIAMLEVWSGSIIDALARYSPTSTSLITINGQQVTRFVYSAEIFEDAQLVGYVFEYFGKVYLLQRLDGKDEYLPSMLQTLIASLEVQ